MIRRRQAREQGLRRGDNHTRGSERGGVQRAGTG